jgi:hypothetical protein
MKQTKNAEPAELPEGTELSSVADYEVADPCKPQNPQPGFRYFAAANDGDNGRPDGVARLKQQGYEVCTEESCDSTDCTLMRIPMKQWEARKKAQLAAANRAARQEGSALAGVPEKDTWRSDEHNKTRKLGR